MRTIADALLTARPCACACHDTLTTDEKTRGVRALYHCDDALRGWGYAPIYEQHGDALWREAQTKGDPSYRGVAVRFGECVYRRLLGSMLHEMLHASLGDTTKANYGVPFGLPYGVPESVLPSDEESWLAPFNFSEARAFVGVWILGRALFDVSWDVRTARDVGTYGFAGGNALVAVPKGYRPVAHLDRNHHTDRYYARARKLEDEARRWFDAKNLDGTSAPEGRAAWSNLEAVIAKVNAAAEKGRASRPRKWPEPPDVARLAPKKVGRNEPCTCGSGQKVKGCCGELAGKVAGTSPMMAR